ncbi:hypothetical protein EGR_03799 [Echinococcus granulosus]|uniref:Uncharacterized protein n=1 Tax=Echinococcus granulosus TaxID=6210 RepID=W6UJT4_ECHGR|nr:hypothetical protein EGR_03799 [Echinococcus granulosus]EUB61313.1 hypothetical protein EGR_03799 [Echinococcus granulosus]
MLVVLHPFCTAAILNAKALRKERIAYRTAVIALKVPTSPSNTHTLFTHKCYTEVTFFKQKSGISSDLFMKFRQLRLCARAHLTEQRKPCIQLSFCGFASLIPQRLFRQHRISAANKQFVFFNFAKLSKFQKSLKRKDNYKRCSFVTKNPVIIVFMNHLKPNENSRAQVISHYVLVDCTRHVYVTLGESIVKHPNSPLNRCFISISSQITNSLLKTNLIKFRFLFILDKNYSKKRISQSRGDVVCNPSLETCPLPPPPWPPILTHICDLPIFISKPKCNACVERLIKRK